MQAPVIETSGEQKSSVFNWPAAPPSVALGEREVQVWCASLEAPPRRVAAFESTLSEDERSRAERYFRFSDQRRFVVARGVLRQLLGGYLECEPASVEFVYGESGKPSLARLDTDLQFNVAHSGEIALYAVARQVDLGVDIEAIREISDMDGIASRFFAPEEVKRLNLLPRQHGPEAFFKCWTRKEAFLKGKGAGIGSGLDKFEVSFAPGEPAIVVHSQLSPYDVREWKLFDLEPVTGFAAALAARADGLEVRCWHFE